MGHKVHPRAFRLGVTHAWDAIWFSAKRPVYINNLREDVQIRAFLKKELREALVDRVEIERARQKVIVAIHTGKPGIIIGRAGAGIDELAKKLKKMFYRGRKVDLQIQVKEITNTNLSAEIVGHLIAFDIEKRMPFRRTMKSTIERVLKAGAQGVKVTLGGRLNGAEIARVETLASGKIPLHNLRADINFARVTARTIAGAIGIKVWINRGEIFDAPVKDESQDAQKSTPATSGPVGKAA